jgi:hypothetical protein
MRRLLAFGVGVLLAQFMVVAALAQQASQTQPAQSKGLEGRWTGSIQTPNGDMAMTATFKKEKDDYTGVMTSERGDMPLKNIKVEGDKVTTRGEVETPNGNIVINYTFTLKEDTLNGKGELEANGQNFAFDINLKRAAEK